MISMSKAYSIRQLRMEGDSIAEISRKLEVSRDTVYKYLAMDDLSQRPPAPRAKGSVLDRYRPLIESWLDEDERNWRKQRHTARRIWARLRDEAGADVAESTVRNYVRRIKLERGASREQYLDLDWEPGDAQADFGEADFYVGGVRTRMSFFVMTFPYSNVGIAQVFPGENAECVCQALRNIFEHVAGVPRRILFDTAAGVGRRVGDAVCTTEMFSAFAAHYGFAYSKLLCMSTCFFRLRFQPSIVFFQELDIHQTAGLGVAYLLESDVEGLSRFHQSNAQSLSCGAQILPRRPFDFERVAQRPEHLAGDVALEAPDGLLLGLSVALALPDVILGPLIIRHPGHRDLVKRPVGAPVAPSVQAMALRFARARQQRGDAA